VTLKPVLATTMEVQGANGRAPTSEIGQEGTPRLRFAVRTSQGVELCWATPGVARDESLVCPTGQALQFSSDGKLLAIINPDTVMIVNADTGQTVVTIGEANVLNVHFSPQALFVLTWKRWDKELQATSTGNVSLWDLKTGERVYNFVQKKLQWPALQWTEDELLSAKMVSSEIQFFVGQKWDHPIKALKVPGVEDFSLAPGVSPPTIAVFVADKKGGPSAVRIYKYPKVGEVVASRTLWKAQTVEFLWNSKGTALLVLTHTSVDRTGKSYYGETGLQFVSADSALDCNVSLDAEGPVHDAKWNPDGTQFVVIYGYMPAQTTLFDEKCQKLAEFGRAPRNTARWSPCGRLLALGGFGNLNGQVDVWDVKRVRKVGSAVTDCGCSMEWSPDSQLLLTAALSPKIRVDNGYTIWHYDGSVYHHCAIPVLYEVKWQPMAGERFPLQRIKVSPQPKASSQTPVPAKPAIYQPPSMRGQVPVVNKEDLEAQKPRKYRAEHADRADLPVGAAADSKNALRNKQRRQRRKQKQSANPQVLDSGAGGLAAAGEPAEEEKKPDNSKQIRALQKKLRQINQLKEKQAAGQQLDKSQLAKIESAVCLELEITKLTAREENGGAL